MHTFPPAFLLRCLPHAIAGRRAQRPVPEDLQGRQRGDAARHEQIVLGVRRHGAVDQLERDRRADGGREAAGRHRVQGVELSTSSSRSSGRSTERIARITLDVINSERRGQRRRRRD